MHFFLSKRNISMKFLLYFNFFQIHPTDGNEMETERLSNYMDLPAELRLEIFEQLGLKDWIHLIKVIPQDRQFMENLFRSMLKNHTTSMRFDCKPQKIRMHVGDIEIMNIANGNENDDFEEILEFFQHFGHFITKFRILDYWYGDISLYEKFQQQIKKYVAESVIEFEIQFHWVYDSRESRIKNLIVPYPNAEFAKISDVIVDAATLQRAFPAVRSLDLGSARVDETLSHLSSSLKHFTVPRLWGSNYTTFDLFEQTLMLNPQITHLSIPDCNYWHIVQKLNELRPDIEHLEFSHLAFWVYQVRRSQTLRFTNMKVFKCKASSILLPHEAHSMDRIPLEFGNLEEIEFSNEDLTIHWVNIMMQNEKLRKVMAFDIVDRDNLQRIANGLPNLEEFTMQYHQRHIEPIQNIVDFMQSANQLKKATFPKLGIEKCNEVAHQLINDWKIEENDMNVCCLIRN